MEGSDGLLLITDEERKAQIQKAKDMGADLIKFSDSDAWVKYDEKDGVTVYTQKSESGLNCVKGEGWVDFNANVLEEFVFSPDTKPKCDESCEEAHFIENYGDNSKFEYLKYKGKLLVSGRDFVTASYKQTIEDGRIVISSYSVVHPDQPEVSGLVRGDIKLAGWIITPDKDSEDRCHAVYITEIDFAGSLPTALVNQVNTNQGFFIAKVKEALKQEYN